VFGYNFNVDSWKIYDVFLMDAITYFMAAGLIFYIPYKQNLQKKVVDSSVFMRLKIGFGYLMKNRNILVFGIFSYMVFAMLLVQIHAVLPAYIKLHLQAKGSSFAIADTIYAVGALCSGFFISKLFKKISLANIIISLTFVVSLIFLWAAVSKSVLVIYIVSLILGFCNAGIRILRLTYLFNHVPNELMGRVGSIFNLINVLTRSIFIYLFSFGFFTINSNVVYCYGIMSAFLMFSAITLLLNEKTVSKSKKAILS
jgi:MFS family permease